MAETFSQTFGAILTNWILSYLDPRTLHTACGLNPNSQANILDTNTVSSHLHSQTGNNTNNINNGSCKVQRIFPKIRSSYSELHSQCVCFGLFGSRTPAVSRHSLARQYSTQSYCLLSVYPTPSCTLSDRGYNWLLITLQPTRMLNRSRESAWRDMASNQRCFILIQFELFHMHAMHFTSLQ